MSASSLDSEHEVEVQVELLTREDTVVMTEGGAVVEKGLVLHGCKPAVKVGDVIIAVNNQAFSSCEDLTQLLTAAAQTVKNFSLKLRRIKGDTNASAQIDRYVIELKRESAATAFGISPMANEDRIFVEKVDGLAAEAGVLPKDLIKRINGEAVQSMDDFTRLTNEQQRIVLYLARGEKIGKTKVEFEEKILSFNVPFESGDILGIVVRDMVVTSIQPGSIAESKFDVDDRIVEINGAKLSDDKQLFKLLQRADGGLDVSVMRSVPVKDCHSDKENPSPTVNRVLISLAMASYEPIGVRPDENMLISTIMDKSHAQGKFELGDVIKSINGISVTNRNQFFKLFEDATSGGRVNIVVERSATRELELEKRQLPPQVEKIIKRHAGFDYIVVNVRYDSSAGRPFGLNIANVTQHKIIIPELMENCVASDFLRPYDHIIAINGTPVSEVAVAKKIIRECNANFQAVVERPVALESQAEIKRAVNEWKARISRPPPPRNLEEMPRDVQEIVLAHMKVRKERGAPPKLISALHKANAPRRRITIMDVHRETQIQSDVPANKRLRPCR